MKKIDCEKIYSCVYIVVHVQANVLFISCSGMVCFVLPRRFFYFIFQKCHGDGCIFYLPGIFLLIDCIFVIFLFLFCAVRCPTASETHVLT